MFGVKAESLFVAGDDLAEAMKKHHWFGVHFFVKNEVKDTTEEESATEASKTIEDELADKENAIIVESVTTKGMAVAYIQGMYGESFTATTVEDMKREAARKWNVIFKNWGK
jgi:diaminopimelate decarboxylase